MNCKYFLFYSKHKMQYIFETLKNYKYFFICLKYIIYLRSNGL